MVLDSLRFSHLDENIFYSRDRTHREVGFVVGRKAGRAPGHLRVQDQSGRDGSRREAGLPRTAGWTRIYGIRDEGVARKWDVG